MNSQFLNSNDKFNSQFSNHNYKDNSFDLYLLLKFDDLLLTSTTLVQLFCSIAELSKLIYFSNFLKLNTQKYNLLEGSHLSCEPTVTKLSSYPAI